MNPLKTLYTRYTDLSVSVLSVETDVQNSKTSHLGYRYTVQSNLHNQVASFKTERDLSIWLEARGLELRGSLPANPKVSEHFIPVSGEFMDACTLDIESFDELWRAGLPKVVVMDNGDSTMGVASTNPEGCRVIHFLNCNISTRPRPLVQRYDYEANKSCLDAMIREMSPISMPVEATEYAAEHESDLDQHSAPEQG